MKRSLYFPPAQAAELAKAAIRFGPTSAPAPARIRIASRFTAGQPLIRGYNWSAWRTAILARIAARGGDSAEIVERNQSNTVELWGEAYLDACSMCNLVILQYPRPGDAVAIAQRSRVVAIEVIEGAGPPQTDLPIQPDSGKGLLTVGHGWKHGAGEWARDAAKVTHPWLYVVALSSEAAFWQPEFIDLA